MESPTLIISNSWVDMFHMQRIPVVLSSTGKLTINLQAEIQYIISKDLRTTVQGFTDTSRAS